MNAIRFFGDRWSQEREQPGQVGARGDLILQRRAQMLDQRLGVGQAGAVGPMAANAQVIVRRR